MPTSNAIWPSEQRPSAAGQEGVLHLLLAPCGSRTVIRDCYARVPLRVLRPVYLDDAGTAYIYLLNPCGGVVGGDRYTLTVTLAAGACAYLTTPAATRLYAAPGAAARQNLEVTLQPGAVLAYLPEQTIPFAEAAWHQQARVRLGAGAWLFLGEVLAPGRLARGEAFAYRLYSASLDVEDAAGQLLLRERTRLQPQGWPRAGLGLLEGYAYLGTLYVLCAGTALPAALADDLHALLAGRRRLLGSATTLECGGLAVRLLSADHDSMSQALADIWGRLGAHGLPCPPRPGRRERREPLCI